MRSRTSILAFALLTLTATKTFSAQDSGSTPAQAPAQAPVAPAAATSFTAEQLEQIAAPIALHPDTLLTMIMMASTYPLEIVEAHRWVQKNAKLTGKALEEALKQHDWDPSVKSIAVFPTVLAQMNDNLDWTQDLGDAFLGQKKELLDTVQKMRRKALESGNLKSTEQQKVSEDDKVIIIESTKTEVVYVPTYSPTVVYGPSWYYPTYYYPPMYYPPPAGAAFFAFSVGVAWGAGAWGDCDWHGGDVDIDIDHYHDHNRNTSSRPDQYNKRTEGGNSSWKHDPAHRKGANYKNPQVAQQYGASAGSNRVTKDQARGYDRSGASKGPSASTRPSTGNVGAQPGRADGATNRAGTTPSSAASRGNSGQSRSSALSGSSSPGLDRSASSRGAASRGTSSRGGGSRGGRGGGGRR